MTNSITNQFNSQSELYDLPDSPTIQELFCNPSTKTLNVDWAWLADNIDVIIGLDERAEEWANKAGDNHDGLFGSQMMVFPYEYFETSEGTEALASLQQEA